MMRTCIVVNSTNIFRWQFDFRIILRVDPRECAPLHSPTVPDSHVPHLQTELTEPQFTDLFDGGGRGLLDLDGLWRLDSEVDLVELLCELVTVVAADP